jgi:hypothetical protein
MKPNDKAIWAAVLYSWAISVLVLLVVGQGRCELPDAPTPHIDKKFVGFVLVDVGAMAADAYTSVQAGKIGCVEQDALLFGSKPSDARFWGQMIATTTAVDVLSWWLRRHRRWQRDGLWSTPLWIDTGFHVVGTHMSMSCHLNNGEVGTRTVRMR